MKIGFIETIKRVGKNLGATKEEKFRVLAKKTTIPNRRLKDDSSTHKRMPPIEQFRTYTKQILPQMEQSIEISMLQKQFQEIKSEELKQDLIRAYTRRRIKDLANQFSKLDDYKKQEDSMRHHDLPELNVYSFVPIGDHDFEDVGKYTMFPATDIQKYFLNNQMFGEYFEVEFYRTRKFGVMISEEGAKIVNHLQHIQDNKETPLNYINLFKRYPTEKIKEKIIEDEDVYPCLFHDLAKAAIEELEAYRNNTLFERLFCLPSLFDLTINVVLRELGENPNALLPLFLKQQEQIDNPQFTGKKVFNQLFEQIFKQINERAHPEFSNPQQYKQFLEDIQKFQISIKDCTEHEIDLIKYCKEPRWIPRNIKKYSLRKFIGFNSGALLYGDSGSGKSGTLLYVTMWAHYKKWIVLNVPSAFNWTQKEWKFVRHPKTGLYIQNELAQDWMKSFKHANSDLLKQIPVNMDIYGFYNLSGQHDKECDAVPDLYYKDRKVNFEEHKKFLTEEENIIDGETNKDFRVRLKEKLTNPLTVLDIIDYGLENEFFATNALYEVLEQIRNQDKFCVLKVIDGYNFMYKRSIYPSFRYATDTQLRSTVPPYHLTVPRAFLNFDGHKFKNGFVLCASSVKNFHKHIFGPDSIDFPLGYSHEMRGLPLDDFRVMCHYYLQNDFWLADNVAKNSSDFLWMHSQGNWAQAHKVMLGHQLDSM
ncbi:ribosomal death-associated protein (macronuclear) [Tetrahymena thermophila SB210]|uniref:Small ribosomal subunit protein mS29 n=1 Tax=Tetrahymena thermophila (strain SB210) TaxID=312017 RepID=Q22RT0_TETTS|nr:ribosomal death-associated protein [Tetrahymena thermophila SB210]EAR88042.2 ribosomal death-associated protein [Tetrahymena thermophila SB210]6Z1P_Bw Chain Bw, Ribosomal death-associated protein [Tetrahymena thermophila SB210]|eukprot:XP_001008287.2 ribosomal death-associated protein [Tetrahymena thermophila SB210]